MKLLFAVLLSFTVIAGAQQIVRSFDAPEVGITGLAYHDNSLYALGSTSKTVFELDEISGSVTNSWGFFKPAEKLRQVLVMRVICSTLRLITELEQPDTCTNIQYREQSPVSLMSSVEEVLSGR